jgi:hypothetical protein
MGFKTLSGTPTGYSRSEFGAIFQVYSQNVYTGLFRDFSLSQQGGRYLISFREEAGQTPLVTIEKRRLGPGRALFVATTPGRGGIPTEIARSEHICAFVDVLKRRIDMLASLRPARTRVARA